jgi:hypothetical protein
MKLRTRCLFTISAVLLMAFVFLLSDFGQKILTAHTKGLTHFELDDRFMGAAIAPWVYLLFPSLVLALSAVISWVFDRTAR